MPPPLIHVFIGTKAQYIKTAPLIRLMDEHATPYRLIDSGQHAELAVDLRSELSVRDPDFRLGGAADVSTIPAAAAWMAKLAAKLWSKKRLRDEVFGGHGGVVVVHGDTPSTLLSTLMARRAGLRVAHIEAGLRSHSLLHPFPEELIRILVMRVSHLLFAPDDVAAANLVDMRVRGEIVRLSANTNVEALQRSLPALPPPGSGPVVATTHRVENLKHRSRLREFVDLIVGIAAQRPVSFVVHQPTAEALRRQGLEERLAHSEVEVVTLLPHAEFTRRLAAAAYVITDGGSIQEECALLGVPTLLWRARTERNDGIGANVVLSGFADSTIRGFVADPELHRKPAADWDLQPSQEILDVLMADLGRSTG